MNILFAVSLSVPKSPLGVAARVSLPVHLRIPLRSFNKRFCSASLKGSVM